MFELTQMESYKTEAFFRLEILENILFTIIESIYRMQKYVNRILLKMNKLRLTYFL